MLCNAKKWHNTYDLTAVFHKNGSARCQNARYIALGVLNNNRLCSRVSHRANIARVPAAEKYVPRNIRKRMCARAHVWAQYRSRFISAR